MSVPAETNEAPQKKSRFFLGFCQFWLWVSLPCFLVWGFGRWSGCNGNLISLRGLMLACMQNQLQRRGVMTGPMSIRLKMNTGMSR